MRKVLILIMGAALVLAISGSAIALDLNLNFDFNVGGTQFSALADGYLGQQAGATVSGVNELITKNDGRVEAEVDLPNIDIDQIGVPLGRVSVLLGATGTLEQLTLAQATNTGFVLSKNEGSVQAEVEIGRGGIYINNLNGGECCGGLYPYDPWNGLSD